MFDKTKSFFKKQFAKLFPPKEESPYHFWPSSQGTLRNTRRSYRHTAVRMFPKLASGRQWVKFRKGLKREGVDILGLPTKYIKVVGRGAK